MAWKGLRTKPKSTPKKLEIKGRHLGRLADFLPAILSVALDLGTPKIMVDSTG